MNKKLDLNNLNEQFAQISNEIEKKMKFLQNKYGFSIDYAFKPITQNEINNFEKLEKPKFKK